MAKDIVESILKQLDAPEANVMDLLQTYQSEEFQKFWRQDARLYRAFGKKLISGGHPTKAFELAREGLVYHGKDLELKYLSALALARGGNISKAEESVNELFKEPELGERLKVEALSLLGRLNKDRYERTRQSTLKLKFSQESARSYERAYILSGNSFPGINAATMSLLSSRPEKARQLAATVFEQAKAELGKPAMENDYWLLATLGEAHILLGDLKEAASWYGKAVNSAKGHVGDIASMRRNLVLLKEKLEVSEEILELFNIGSVVVFSGHMIDHPTREVPRFPPDPELEQKVSLAIKEEIEKLNATVGYCSAACGSDILFAERMLERDAELHIVLPFARKDFYSVSVDFDLHEMSEWRRRCDALLDNSAVKVHYATTENFLGDDILFEFVNTFTQGLAITRAVELGAEPYALLVLDPASEKLFGGTAYFRDRWTAGGRKARTIDLAAIRSQVVTKPRAFSRTIKSPQVTGNEREIKRQVKVMLFSDVKNFSKLEEEQAPSFFATFLAEVARVIENSKHPPVFRNTWGDGLFLVFDRVTDCADFAMRLLDRIQGMDFKKLRLPEDTTVRMGIHAGPVYPYEDKIINRTNFFGSHVNRAARIEPVTTPGCAFTTEQFAAILAVEPGHDFICEYVGIEDLAKGYDRVPLYRLGQR